MNTRRALPLVLLLSLVAPVVASGAGGFDERSFARFVDALGVVDAPREYVYAGEAYDYSTGRVIARIEGYQISRVSVAKREAHVWRRAFLLYRSPEDGHILASYPEVRGGSPALLSLTRYELLGDRLKVNAWVGGGGKSRALHLPDDTTAAHEAQRDVFRRTYGSSDAAHASFEIQETVVARGGARARSVDVRSTLFKVAEGSLFPSQIGRYVVSVAWWPMVDRAGLSPSLRLFLRDEAPAMMRLPASLQEAKRELGVASD